MSTVQVYPPPPSILSHHPPPPFLPGSFPSPIIQKADSSNASNLHINPSVLVIVIILSVVFICSGILHLLARCLGRRRTHVPPLTSPVNSIRGQLQHLFTLHDAGVEQVFIDTLPVFLYGSIRGLKDSADCAVCLNEFAEEDRLRLLPKCKHAFHLECIDTWLLSNSTCPLCRRSLLPDAETAAGVAVDGSSQRMRPPSLVHDSGGCARAFAGSEQDENQAQQHGSFRMWGTERTTSLREIVQVPEASPPQETPLTPGAPTVCVTEPDGSEKVLRVELGKVNVDSRRVSSGAGNLRRPRSYSMGSYEYIVDFSNLQLTLQPTPYPGHPQNWAPSKPTHRSALSDSIPELASAGQTPGNEDLFWASRGLDTPQSLSRAREIMSPSPGRFAFSPTLYDSQDCSPIVADEATSSHEQGFTIDYDDEENVEGEEEAYALSRRKGSEGVRSLGIGNEEVEMTEIMNGNGTTETELEQKRSSSLRLPEENSEPLSATLGLPPAAEQKFHEVSVDVSVPSSSVEDGGKNVLASLRRSSLSWLRGRGRRLVYSAATPSPVQDIHIAGKVELTLMGDPQDKAQEEVGVLINHFIEAEKSRRMRAVRSIGSHHVKLKVPSAFLHQ